MTLANLVLDMICIVVRCTGDGRTATLSQSSAECVSTKSVCQAFYSFASWLPSSEFKVRRMSFILSVVLYVVIFRFIPRRERMFIDAIP